MDGNYNPFSLLSNKSFQASVILQRNAIPNRLPNCWYQNIVIKISGTWTRHGFCSNDLIIPKWHLESWNDNALRFTPSRPIWCGTLGTFTGIHVATVLRYLFVSVWKLILAKFRPQNLRQRVSVTRYVIFSLQASSFLILITTSDDVTASSDHRHTQKRIFVSLYAQNWSAEYQWRI